MTRMAIAVSIVALTAAALFGVRQYTQANAAYPITTEDADVNYDGRINSIDLAGVASKFNMAASTAGRPVLEQNLDTNGNIRVHEQGILNVAVQSNTGTTTTILDADVAGTFYTSFVNVERCDSRMVLLAERSASLNFDNRIGFIPSPDGVTSYGIEAIPPNIVGTPDGYATWSEEPLPTAYLDVTGHNLGPFMQFAIRGPSQHVTIKLYCR